jgi:type I restriction enzyme S subunit
MAGEWRKIRLGELGFVITGRTPPGTLPEYFGDEIPFITPTDMDGRRKVGETARLLSPKGVEILKRVVVQRGVAVSCIGWQMGKSVLIDRPAATNQQINTLIPSRDLADDLFVYYSLSAQRDSIFRLGAGGSRTPILNKSGFEAFEIDLPPLPEQQAIAHILGTLDDKIELNRRMNATLEAMARALFQSWFVDFDPVRAKLDGRPPAGLDEATAALFPAHFQDSPLGPIPQGWEVKPMSEVIEVNPRRTLKSGAIAPYLDMKNMPTQGHAADEIINREFNSGTKFQNGDTLLARITPCLENGKTAFVDFLEEGQVGWGSTEYIVFVPKLPLTPEFGYYLARSDALRLHAIQNMTGTSGRQRVPSDCFSQFRFAVPPAKIAKRFGEITSPWMKQIHANIEQSRTLATLRDTLLPKLLSGELRVAEINELAHSSSGTDG